MITCWFRGPRWQDPWSWHHLRWCRQWRFPKRYRSFRVQCCYL